MLHQLYNFSRKENFLLAFSSGVDSVAIADFYKKGNKNFTLAYFNHATPQSSVMEKFAIDFANKNNIPIVIGKLTNKKPAKQSYEEFWRDERYNWLRSFNKKIVTCHHLNDVAETWIFSSLHGNGKIIRVYNDNVYRPFLTNKKQTLIDWAVKNNQTWIEDESNKDIHFPRNRIRHVLLPQALLINPGLFKVLKRKVIEGSLYILKEGEVAYTKNTSGANLSFFINSNDEYLRKVVAQSKIVTESAFKKLSKDKSLYVRRSICHNSKVTDSALIQLMNDKDAYIKNKAIEYLAQRKNLTCLK